MKYNKQGLYYVLLVLQLIVILVCMSKMFSATDGGTRACAVILGVVCVITTVMTVDGIND